MRFKKFWRKYKLYITGVWGILTTILSLYWTVFPFDQNPELSYYRKSSVDVFNVDRWVNGFHIEFNGHDFRANNLNLKVIKLDVVNDGRKDITPELYAANPPFGLKVQNGEVIHVDVAKSGRSVTKRNLIQKFSADSSFVFFQHLFWPKDERITLNVWIAHDKSATPKLTPSGRIADTPITLTDDPEKQLSWGEEAKLVFIYLFMYVFSWAIPFVFLIYLFEYLQKKTRKQRVRKAYGINYDPSNKSQRVLIEFAGSLKRKDFAAVVLQMHDKPTRDRTYLDCRSVREQFDRLEALVDDSPYLVRSHPTNSINFKSDFWSLVLLLREAQLIEENEDDPPVLHTEFEQALALTIKTF